MKDHSPGLRRGSALWLAVTGIMTAMNIALSMSIFSVPVPGGHLYFCDVIINTAAILLDPFAAFVVGGVGSFVGDMLFYPAPMFVSLAAHGLQAAAASFLCHRLTVKHPAAASLAGVSLGSVIMVLIYTLGRAYVYATAEYAILKLPFEILQAALGAVLSMILCYPLRVRSIFQRMTRGMRW